MAAYNPRTARFWTILPVGRASISFMAAYNPRTARLWTISGKGFRCMEGMAAIHLDRAREARRPPCPPCTGTTLFSYYAPQGAFFFYHDTGGYTCPCADHEHEKMAYRGVRGRLVWLTLPFRDRVRHCEQHLNMPRSTSACSWFVKWRVPPQSQVTELVRRA